MTERELSPETIADENRNALDVGTDAVEPRQEQASLAERGEPPVEEKPKAPVRGSKFDDKRQAIYEKARLAREAQDDDTTAEEVSASRDRMFGKNVETHADRVAGRNDAEVQPPAQQQQQPEAPQAKRKLKVNGREVELDENQVEDYARRALAADDILGQAKALKREQQQILEELRAARTVQSADVETPATRTAPKPASLPDDTELDEIIDKIQVGDPKEAKAALEKYGSALEARILDRIGNLDETIASHVELVNENSRRREQTHETLRSFGENNPEFRNSPALQAALAQEAAQTMRSRMFEIGVEPETLDRLKAERGLNDIEVTAFAYRTLQQQGHQLPAHPDILKESAASLRRQFGMATPQPPQSQPQPAVDMREREDRKRALATQPRRATVPSAIDAQERSREDVRRQAIQQMRKARRGR